MCGIAGYAGDPGSRPGPREIGRVLSALRHRGPDGEGHESRGAAVLLACRLAVTGGAAGQQPLSRPGGGLLVGNGEIFNFRELARDGEEGAADLRPALRLLDEESPGEALAQLRGTFALAHVDRAGTTLTLARDEWGVKPLCVARVAGGVAFASEIKAILAMPGVPRTVDDEALATYLAFQFPPPGRTLWRGIETLPPGTWLSVTWKDGRCVERRGTFRHRGAEGPPGPLRDEFLRACDLQGRRETPAGLLLSGGFDSTALLGGLHAAGRAPDFAVCGFVPGDPACDERHYARAAALAFGVPLREVAVDAERWAAALPATLRALDHPVAGPGAVGEFLVAREAAGSARILYSGQGGDELFAGYERHRILRGDAATAAYAPLEARMRRFRDPDEALILGALFRADELLPHLVPEIRRRIERDVVPRELDRLRSAPGAGVLDRALSYERTAVLPGLIHVGDRTQSAFGIEARLPLLDPVFAGRVAAFPADARCRGGRLRALFLDELGGFLPPEVRRRTDKRGFPVPFDRWARGPLRGFIADTLAATGSVAADLLEAGALRRLLDAPPASGRGIWGLLCLELWRRAVSAVPAAAGA